MICIGIWLHKSLPDNGTKLMFIKIFDFVREIRLDRVTTNIKDAIQDEQMPHHQFN